MECHKKNTGIISLHGLVGLASHKVDTTKALVLLNGAVVWMKLGKQSIVMKSSFESEFVALNDTSSIVIWQWFPS